MTWKTQGEDIVLLSFGLRVNELERLIPSDISLDTRTHEGEEYGFLTLGLVKYTEFYHENFPVLSLDFPKAFLALSIQDSDGTPSYYLKRLFLPRLQGWLFRWFGGFPTKVMSIDYPTTAHPGGEYRWTLSNGGAGILRGKIEQQTGTTGRLLDFFESSEAMSEFFWNRNLVYSGSPGAMRSSSITLSDCEPYPIVFEKMELGFLAEDLERHQFPEAVIGSFFVPDCCIQISGVSKSSL
ncbi:MAG: hypothetical protein ABEK50_14400 [bacterium]